MSWVKLHRKFLEWEWYSDINAKTVFLHLLIKANYEDKKWQGLVIKRGQIVIGSITLAEEVGLTRQQVRTAFEKLRLTNEITIEATSKYTIVTVVKYEEYQSGDDQVTSKTTSTITNEQPAENDTITEKDENSDANDNQQNNQQTTSYQQANQAQVADSGLLGNQQNNQPITNEQPTDNQRITTTKEIQERKKERKKEEYIGDFLNFWNRYGKVGNKQSAENAFKKIKGVDYETVIAGLDRYQNYCRANASWYSPQHASTWLNSAGWKSEYPVTESPATTRQGSNSQPQQSKSERARAAAAQGLAEYRAMYGQSEPAIINAPDLF